MADDEWKSRLSSLEAKMVTRDDLDATKRDIKEMKEMMIQFFSHSIAVGVHQGAQAAGRASQGRLKLNACSIDL